jgi:hypothetical protein
MNMGGGGPGGDSDDDEGEEAQVDPHMAGEKADGNLDDLDGEAEEDLKK